MCVWSLRSSLSQFRMVLEICPIEFSQFWGFDNIIRPLEMPIATNFNVCNYLHWIPVGIKLGKSVVFEVENQKMKVKTLKKIRFQLKYGHIRGKNNEKCLNWYMVVKLYVIVDSIIDLCYLIHHYTRAYKMLSFSCY